VSGGRMDVVRRGGRAAGTGHIFMIQKSQQQTRHLRA
jgi:hypothetical protein